LNKNVAKSLAKQIIAGIGTKEMEGVGFVSKEQKPKSLEEKSEKELEYAKVGSLETYRSKVLGRPLSKIKQTLRKINEQLANEDVPDEEKQKFQAIKDYYLNQEAEDRKAYADYRNDMNMIKELGAEKEIHKFFGYVEDWVAIPLDDRRDMFWKLNGGEGHGATVLYNEDRDAVLNETGEHYESAIYTQRFLPKWVYRADGYTLICLDTQCDGNKFLSIFDNSKEVM